MGNSASFSIDRSVNVVIAKQPDYFGVSKSDWSRLKRKVDACKSRTDWWMNVGFTSFGITGSSLLSYFALPITPDSNWARPTIICFGIFSFLIGLLCIIAHRREATLSTSTLEEVKDVIKEIDASIVITEPE